jgi:hypothetical protein
MAGFKSFANAAITLAGIELAHRIRKGQFSFGRGRRRRGWSRKDEWSMALAYTMPDNSRKPRYGPRIPHCTATKRSHSAT